LILEKDNDGFTFLHYLLKINNDVEIFKYVFDFTEKNFPEIISDKHSFFSNKNLVLPLTFQIQN